MVTKWKKFIQKHPYKSELEEIIKDIRDDNLKNYYIKPLKGHSDLFRIRKGKIRIVFQKNKNQNSIIAVDTRGNIYRGL